MKLRIKLFQDGAELPKMIDARKRGLVDGFTTNPTLMRKARVVEYRALPARCCHAELPVWFEVFSDDVDEMRRQARLIDSWGATCSEDPRHHDDGRDPRARSFGGPLGRRLSASTSPPCSARPGRYVALRGQNSARDPVGVRRQDRRYRPGPRAD